MYTLYKIIADPEYGEILTLISLGLFFLAYLLFKGDDLQKRQVEPTNFDRVQLLTSGIIAFFCGVLVFGKIFVSQNTEDLLVILGLSDFLNKLTINFQALVLGFLGLLM
ncbi:MAG: hypothetical protein KKB51_08880 [Candidatus Riflebacteria bacterium]|nr:hypothetical protein [Candidatus Riflebacteria bacterium]